MIDYHEAIGAIVSTFCADIGRLSEEEAKTWPNGDRLIELARALCASTSPYPNDLDVNRLTLGIEGGQIMFDVKRTAAMQMPVQPAWWLFLREAQVALDYLGADVPNEKAVDFLKAVREIVRP